MRKVFLFQNVSLDGYFEGPNHDISFFNEVDDEHFEPFSPTESEEPRNHKAAYVTLCNIRVEKKVTLNNARMGVCQIWRITYRASAIASK